MKAAEILKAERVAKDFLARIEEYNTEVGTYRRQGWSGIPPKQSGALRRASMELTRQLAQMRKA